MRVFHNLWCGRRKNFDAVLRSFAGFTLHCASVGPHFQQTVMIMRFGAKHWHDCRNLFVVKAPSGRNIDLAMAVYADDVMRMFATPQSRLYKLVAHMRSSCNEVSDCLVPYSLKQNRHKRMVVPYVKGSRSKAFLRFLTSSPTTKDVVVFQARYLGARVTCYGNNTAERQQRSFSMHRGFAEMGSCWFNTIEN